MANISDDSVIIPITTVLEYIITIGKSSLQSQVHTVVPNNSVPDGCIELRFDEMEFLPWDNPDNIVSVQVETMIRRTKEKILAVLFLIALPANIINLAVFYKQGLKDRVNMCLFSLSFADAMYSLQPVIMNSEQLFEPFVSPEVYGPVMTFLVNNNMVGFFGVQWVSQILSAIIATERCLCISYPLKFQALMQTKIMAIIIIAMYILVIGPFFFVAFRYRVGCVYDPLSGMVLNKPVTGKVYYAYKDLITYLDNFVYGAGIPGAAIILVTTMTVITTVKLRQVMTWRSAITSSISTREVALTKMLIGSSLLFMACVTPVGVFRVVCIVLPNLNTGERLQNIYLSGIWVLEIFSYTNSTFNIFVYYTMGSRYRETFWLLFNRQKSKDISRKVTSTKE